MHSTVRLEFLFDILIIHQQNIVKAGYSVFSLSSLPSFGLSRVATVREKYLENEIFSRSGNS